MDFYSMMLAKKLNKESGGDVTIESLVVTENGNYSETGKAYSPVVVNVQPTLETLNATVNGTYTPQGDGYSEVNVNVPLPENGYLLESASGQVVNITDAAPLYLQECKAEVEAVQDLHGYDHPWVEGAGKNKLNYDLWKTVPLTKCTAVWENNGVTLTATKADAYTNYSNSNFFTKVKPNSFVTLCWEEDSDKDGTNYIFVYDSNYNLIDRSYANNSLSKRIRITTPSNAAYIDFRFGVAANGNTISYKNIQLLFTYEITTFAPYSNICPISGRTEEVITQKDNPTNPTVTKTYTIQLGQTVYGGQLDVTRGKMVVDKAEKDLGDLNYTYDSSNTQFYTDVFDNVENVDFGNVYCISSCYEVDARNPSQYSAPHIRGFKNKRLYIVDTRYTDATQFKTAVTGQQLVYELATPFTIDLTPQQIRLLEGTNNLSCNTGDLNIEYLGKGVN